ncbi:low molecular weight phosphotyrosine protein phosphatase 1-like [Ischnura elegans]|uniref:low molecular weight phosphotyrosine protein phosphatase 1-like n=1 Tax=Ischnura elegans TaxID=197161 RepID=UPI001ED89C3B|nr:low molecular weight phosphotyrosine protein phosphatase 1-like [Ischnura elegans]
MAEKKKRILFICLGNICRSPMAMAIFRHLTDEWECDSAALGPWHAGNSPDSRARKTLDSYGIKLTHSARQVTKNDFHTFDIVMGMDDENMRALKKLAPSGTEHKLKLITEYDPEKADCVPDPYYDSGSEGFDLCYKICKRSLENFLAKQ